ncbi:MAG: hypothetical protein DYG90_03990 [Chloroflexi bacterium CFX6]|nr:hypothetical protein [Chloroflexi bacterium CFX6]
MIEAMARALARLAISICGLRIVHEEALRASIVRGVTVTINGLDGDGDDDDGLDVFRRAMDD